MKYKYDGISDTKLTSAIIDSTNKILDQRYKRIINEYISTMRARPLRQ